MEVQRSFAIGYCKPIIVVIANIIVIIMIISIIIAIIILYDYVHI